jgi:soluble lytic murein transglycosylase-like protein
MGRLTGLVTAMTFCALAQSVHAAEWEPRVSALQAAAAEGDPKAQTELAVKYEHAEGVPKDFAKANALYCEAAKRGYAEAQFQLAWVYANGRGVPRDDGVAATLLDMAASQGHEYAAKLLPHMLKHENVQLPACLLPELPALAASEGPDTFPGARREIVQLVRELAPMYAVDYRLVMAVIRAESAFNPVAVSPKKAQGLMQLIPETAERFGVKKVFNPAENIKGGLAYLQWLLAFFQGDVRLVLAAYNAGERAVEKYRGIPPYAETRNYVKKILGVYKKPTHPYDAGVVDPSPIMARIKRTES